MKSNTPTKSSAKTKSTKGKPTAKPSVPPQKAKVEEEKPKYAEPPYKFRFVANNTKLLFTVTLQKIPVKCVEYNPTPTRMVVSTLKYSKKFYLDVPYPEGVSVVAPETSTADFLNGQLKAVFDVVGAEKVPVNNKNNKKRKGTEATTVEKKKDNDHENDGGENGHDNDGADDEGKQMQESKNKKAKKSQPSAPAKKNKQVDEKTALKMITEIANREEAKIQQKLGKEEEKHQYLQQKSDVKEHRHQQKVLKKRQAEIMMQTMVNEKKKTLNVEPIIQKKPRVIRFADEGATAAQRKAKSPKKLASKTKKK